MALQSGGVIKKGVVWTGSPASWDSRATLALNGGWSSYAAIYRTQLWVQTVISKRARGTARLPLKVYERDDLNRPEAADHPYSQLLHRPNPRQSPFEFWQWVSSIYDVYGEAFLGKVRDRGGRPVALIPMHPTAMHEEEERDGRTIWTFQNSSIKLEGIPDEDLVHPKTFNPDSFTRGLSNLESLRSTLENEDASRRATSSFWRNGGRPSLVMVHPGTMSQPAMDRLKVQWDSIHAGVDNFGKTAILEEGMKPEVISLSAEEAQYIESRKLNREEVCAAYDVPPPVVHILDHATYSNITEQMRSMYRDTMAPHLKGFESALEMQLRDGRRPGSTDPDFGDDVYAEFLLDEVLRGDFETRSSSYQQGITSGWLTPAEVRRMENLPFIEGSDRLLVQGAMVPMQAAAATPPAALSQPEAPLELPPAPARGVLTADEVRTVMGRLSRPADLADVDGAALVAGLNGASGRVLAEFNASKAVGETVPHFRARIKALGGNQ